MVPRVEVAAPGGSYGVVVGEDLPLGEIVSGEFGEGTGVILTDSNVGPLHARRVESSLREAGWNVLDVIEVPAGEGSKSFEVYADVVSRLARSGLGRDGVLFTLGGGVVGDLGGFAAASYLRGIRFVALPTSLLAMVDSSVGGKVGIDLPEGKNLVGSFLQPRLVAADVALLQTLPGREISCGLAEVMKMGLLCGGDFFERLEVVGKAKEGDAQALESLILDSVRFKAGVVEEDEKEAGLRTILNYGHTIGHGIEAAADYGILHGEAVAAGMCAAAFLSAREFGKDLTPLHRELAGKAGLPSSMSIVNTEKVLSAMRRDKKRLSSDGSSEYRFVLLREVGDPVWGVKVDESEVLEAIGIVAG